MTQASIPLLALDYKGHIAALNMSTQGRGLTKKVLIPAYRRDTRMKSHVHESVESMKAPLNGRMSDFYTFSYNQNSTGFQTQFYRNEASISLASSRADRTMFSESILSCVSAILFAAFFSMTSSFFGHLVVNDDITLTHIY